MKQFAYCYSLYASTYMGIQTLIKPLIWEEVTISPFCTDSYRNVVDIGEATPDLVERTYETEQQPDDVRKDRNL